MNRGLRYLNQLGTLQFLAIGLFLASTLSWIINDILKLDMIKGFILYFIVVYIIISWLYKPIKNEIEE